MALRGKPGVLDNEFLKYSLLAPINRDRLLQATRGSTVPRVLKTDITGLHIWTPTFAEQRAIAGVLGALDDKIEQNRRTAEGLEKLARAIFRAWFVDFEPVHAKAAGATFFPGMPPAVFDSLPTRLIDSELGPIPEGWGVEELGEIADEVRRAAQPSEVDPSTPYIGLEHMPRRRTTLDDWEPVSKVTSNKSRFNAGQILFGKLRPYFHKVGVAPLDGVCSTDIVVVDAPSEPLRTYTLAVVSSDEFVAYTNACSTGTKMPRTKWGDMRKYPVTLAPAEVTDAYHDIVAPMLSQSIAGVFESRKLAELRDYLLPKLLSGEVRVKAAANEEAYACH
ncbi:hypothetical protein Pla108_35160 [Botrimarina colliarenosi]|uniref:EcoKI restriction-modification system protein HsdS n=2 Tax=Botrimarina colliarenosi TaxID=2528001 RepID=A0A5C6A7V0_9BACT|nr:hypothetical protein Pla108_35160 [Botrimarina colliarenosi]